MSGKQFSEVFLPLSGDLYRVAYYILESEQDAEDEVQELFLKLWGSRDSLDSVYNPKAYCIRLIRNQCIDRIRKCRFSASAVLPEDISDNRDVHSDLESKESLERAVCLIQNLSKAKRDVIRMYVIDEMSYDEISKITGMSKLTIRVLVSQARSKIRKSL